MIATPVPSAVTLVILAGGEGRRMGGEDKGLMLHAGRPLIAHVIARVGTQASTCVISANRSRARYAAWGYPVRADLRPGFCGPLAGIEAALAAVRTPWALIVPCDLPNLPGNLLERLAAAAMPAGQNQAGAAVACSDGRRHLVLLLPMELSRNLPGRLLDAGERRVQALIDAFAAHEVSFDDQAAAFANFNTPDALLS